MDSAHHWAPWTAHTTGHYCCLSSSPDPLSPNPQAPSMSPSLRQMTNAKAALGAPTVLGLRSLLAFPGFLTFLLLPGCLQTPTPRDVPLSSPSPGPQSTEAPLTPTWGGVFCASGTDNLPRGVWGVPAGAQPTGRVTLSGEITQPGRTRHLVPSNPKGAGAELRGRRRGFVEGGRGSPQPPSPPRL